MNRNRVTLKQLRGFVATLRFGTIAAAAADLNLTPPAIALQLRLLEETVGLALYERTRDGIRPTAAGREIVNCATRIETALIECGEALGQLRGGGGGPVNVGVVSTAKYYVPKALAAFKKRHPKMELRLQVGNRGDIIDALENFQLDFVVMGRPPTGLAVEKAEIADHPHFIIAPPDHRLVGVKSIPLVDLGDEVFLLRERQSGTRGLMQRLFDSAGLNPSLGMEIGSNETIKQAVIAGLGIALISAHTVQAELADKRLAVLDVEGLPVIRKWNLVRLRNKRLLPTAQALWEFLAESGADFLPGTGGRKS
ncbi:MAG: LysR family transcriptional regulator [Alphaproteobacteria bacterium]